MAAVNTLTALDDILKSLQVDELYADVGYRKRPLFGIMPKREDFGARDAKFPVKYADPQSRSRLFATAQTLSTTAANGEIQAVQFTVTHVNDYMIFTITGESIDMATGDDTSFVSALDDIISGSIRTLSNAIEHFMYRDGSGSLGTIGAVASSVITLTNVEEVTLFEVGMELEADSTDNTGGSLRAAPATATVTKVNRSDGKLTMDTLTDWAAGDFLFQQGDHSAGAGGYVKYAGLEAWCPGTAPGAGDSHFGKNRSVDSRLYGLILDATTGGYTLENAFIEGQAMAGREEHSPSVGLICPAQWRKLAQELGARKERSDPVLARTSQGPFGRMGFSGFRLYGDGDTEMSVVSSAKCQERIGWLLSPESWRLWTVGTPVKFSMHDGLRLRAISNDDGFEGRLLTRGQVVCNRPNSNVHVKLSDPN